MVEYIVNILLQYPCVLLTSLLCVESPAYRQHVFTLAGHSAATVMQLPTYILVCCMWFE